MLDAYIIDRIRHERERSKRQDAGIPLHLPLPEITGPEKAPAPPTPPPPAEPERGSVVIDFSI